MPTTPEFKFTGHLMDPAGHQLYSCKCKDATTTRTMLSAAFQDIVRRVGIDGAGGKCFYLIYGGDGHHEEGLAVTLRVL